MILSCSLKSEHHLGKGDGLQKLLRRMDIIQEVYQPYRKISVTFLAIPLRAELLGYKDPSDDGSTRVQATFT